MRFAIFLVSFASSLVLAEKADIKIKDFSTSSGKAIVIQEGKLESATTCVKYELVDGKEQVFGSPEYDKAKAYTNWKAACAEWKASIREMNKESRLITLNCNAPTVSKENDQHTYTSQGTFKLRLKIQDKE